MKTERGSAMNYIETKWQAAALSDRLLLAHYDEEHAKYHARRARQSLIYMLSQDINPDARGTLVDVIENAIDDVYDPTIPLRENDFAEAIIDALLENVVPMPMPEEDEQ